MRQELLRKANSEQNVAWACLAADHSGCGLNNKRSNKGVPECRRIVVEIDKIIQSCKL